MLKKAKMLKTNSIKKIYKAKRYTTFEKCYFQQRLGWWGKKKKWKLTPKITEKV